MHLRARKLLEGCRARRAALARGDYGAAATITRSEASTCELAATCVSDDTANVALEHCSETGQGVRVSTSRPEDVLVRADRCLAESRVVAERARALLSQLQSDVDAHPDPATASYARSWPRAVILPAATRDSSPLL